MLVIPAIDIKDGRCVRLTQGDFSRQTVYDGNPLTVARRWQREGASLIHVVDLDGAQHGSPVNRELIGRLAASSPIPLQVGGGIRDLDTVDWLLKQGVSRVIIGTVALEDPELLSTMLAVHDRHIIVALDAKNGELVTHGWQVGSRQRSLVTALTLQQLGVRRFMYTDTVKDGTLTEPNYTEIEQLTARLSTPLIIGGGVSTLGAIRQLRRLQVEGVVVGKALYEHKLGLPEAISAG
jgi:phosphoribosylformimino-5-aminoimidazole carboxamide ribotide isomerase